MKWLILIFGIGSNAAASVLIKIAMLPPHVAPSLSEPWQILRNWPLLAGVGLYGSAFVLYAVALRFFPLNVAHPVLTAGAIATVALCSYVFLQERFYWTTGIGIALILLGVVFLTARVA